MRSGLRGGEVGIPANEAKRLGNKVTKGLTVSNAALRSRGRKVKTNYGTRGYHTAPRDPPERISQRW